MIAGFLAINMHAPKSVLIFEGGYIGGHPPTACTDVGDSGLGFQASYMTSLWRVFSDLQRGYCDLAIIGCAQVDKYGNVNSTAIFQNRIHHKPIVRLPGSGGANDMVSSARRTMIMARLERRRFVPQVDYITSPGYINGPGAREKVGLKGGGPVAVITDKAVFGFDENTKEMYLSSIYPGVSVEDVKREVCWNLKIAKDVKIVEPPTVEEVKFIRSYDPTDVILRTRRLFENVDFSSWVTLTKSNWHRFTQHL
jgi:glutaconate CoA-transferase subunit B